MVQHQVAQMIPAFLTTICFSLSAVSGNQCARVFGGVEACFWRLLIATIFLGTYVLMAGNAVTSAAASLFISSGIIGVGCGDMLFFQALPRIGSRMTVLIIQCLSIPVAATIEWLWLDSKLTFGQIVADMLVITGICITLLPFRHAASDARKRLYGILFAAAAAIGNGLGAVLSRRAYQFGTEHGLDISGPAAAFSRVFGGVLVGTILLLIVKRTSLFSEDKRIQVTHYLAKWRQAWPWVLTTSLAGQTLGVTCFQWALKHNPTGVVLPILATTPLVTIPVTRIVEKDRISARAIIGTIIAVTGVVLLVNS
jgi:drug/metabolite transporter (DMT)-like permease